jgi:hypothetical protein
LEKEKRRIADLRLAAPEIAWVEAAVANGMLFAEPSEET